MGSLPTWAHSYAAGNIMFTRSFLGANSDVLQSNGFIDLANSTSLSFPQDVSDSTGASASSVNGTSGNGGSSGNDTHTSAPSSGAVISTSSSKILLGLVVGFSTYMMF
jgi:hypothetical protein